jgi:anti-sigma factor RsiW
VTAAHLDYDTLSELAEGLLSDARAASADEHLATCPECQDRSAEIADVPRLLAETPVPPMPAELASRIDQALAAEAESSVSVVSLEARRNRRRARFLSAAAAAVIVVGGGAVIGHALLTGSVSSDNQTAQSQPVQDRTGSPGARAPATKPSALQAPGEAGGSSGYQAVQSGTDYTAARFGDQLSAELAKGESRAKAELAPRPLSGCVGRVAQGKVPLLVDMAKYEGQPATVIVLPGARADRLDVWVVGPNCSATDTAMIKHVQTSR